MQGQASHFSILEENQMNERGSAVRKCKELFYENEYLSNWIEHSISPSPPSP
jgi:hypothetical protein